ncbi:MAG: TetR/AcrR family transcriptional regulator [Actinomycetota bacterium]|nr:TetR/AcrR family transcriptional regulator [Actinomycetota bacterium]
MSEPVRPLRADAARNRARVLEVAYETFAAEGLAVPIDEIARRAGVGAGTVYRHFPTKEALFEAVFSDRVRRIVEDGRALVASEGPGDALFAFLRELVRSSATDHGLFDALAGYGMDVAAATSEAEAAFLAVLGELLTAAQDAGTMRADVGVPEVKALLVVCKSSQDYGPGVADRVTQVIADGLRPRGG